LVSSNNSVHAVLFCEVYGTRCNLCCLFTHIWQVRKLSREGRSRNRSYAVYAPCYTVTEEATRDCKNNVYCGLCCSCTWNLHLFFFGGFRREREFTVTKNNVKLCLGLLRKGLLLVLFSVFFWISLYLLQYYYTSANARSRVIEKEKQI